ncbi:MAG: hypothetical protein A2666_05075 [Parcubacteria group bacterium RIFCSPHIGHO2_01_FULL_47_10b]|nr:MAG: hypothetical protein A2666_05075 [Parcubacteria group bacterium RIFCSPHIGHO2_01_FULL_47_10b]
MDPEREPLVFGKSPDRVTVIPLGGLEEIGKNMMAIEYMEEILIVDMGLMFPEEDMPGVDYIIPDINALQGKEHKVRGVVITHAHYDHIGAIPHLMVELGNPPMYTGRLSAGIIRARQEDYPDSPPLNIVEVESGHKVSIGPFKVEFIHVNHNIPDSYAVAITTPVGTIIMTGDYKFDEHPIGELPADTKRLQELGDKGVLLLMSDSTDSHKKGHSISEYEVKGNLEEIIRENIDRRIIMATFSSLITRIQQIFDLAEIYNRKVAIDGFSMKRNVEIAKNLGFLKVGKGIQIDANEVKNYKPSQIIYLCTGAQGEGNAVLMRIANAEHRFMRILPNDVVVFSSSVIPGNERTVQRLKDQLYRQDATVVHYQMMDIHSGGHPAEDDVKSMLRLVRPKFFVPVHGNYFMLKIHSQHAQAMGVKKENCILAENGTIMHFEANACTVDKKKARNLNIFVDGLGVGDVGEIVLRDRQKMAEDGMFVIIVTIDAKTGKVGDRIDIISRGFVYMNEAKDLMKDARSKIRDIVDKTSHKDKTTNWVYVKDNLRDRIGQFLFQRTHRRPLVLPVVMEM